MAHAAHEVVIDRPIVEVFVFLSNGLNDPLWRKGVLEIERTTETVGVGATYKQTISGPGGARMPGDYVVTAYDPPRLLAFEVTAGPVRPAGRFELTEDGSSRTKVSSTLDVTPTGAMRLVAGLIGKELDNEVRQIERLKQTLEQ